MDPYSWGWDVEILLLVPLMTAAYAVAVQRWPAERWQILSFAAAQVMLLAAYITPLETLALEYLLTAHLLQNVVTAEWAPALVAVAIPAALGARLARFRVLRVMTHPLVALPLWLATYFVWHLPALYDTALRHPATLLHVEHACYFAAGLALWWPVFQDEPWHMRNVAKAGYLFAAFVLASPIGLLLALLPDPAYAFYEDAPRIWGMSALTDQQIAGITMAVEQSVVFFALFALYFSRFLREQETQDYSAIERR